MIAQNAIDRSGYCVQYLFQCIQFFLGRECESVEVVSRNDGEVIVQRLDDFAPFCGLIEISIEMEITQVKDAEGL